MPVLFDKGSRFLRDTVLMPLAVAGQKEGSRLGDRAIAAMSDHIDESGCNGLHIMLAIISKYFRIHPLPRHRFLEDVATEESRNGNVRRYELEYSSNVNVRGDHLDVPLVLIVSLFLKKSPGGWLGGRPGVFLVSSKSDVLERLPQSKVSLFGGLRRPRGLPIVQGICFLRRKSPCVWSRWEGEVSRWLQKSPWLDGGGGNSVFVRKTVRRLLERHEARVSTSLQKSPFLLSLLRARVFLASEKRRLLLYF